MSTPQSDVLDYFHTEFQSLSILDPNLENQLFVKALGDFELDLYQLDYDEGSMEISEDLSRSEMNLLSMLMYKHYLSRERDRVLKINNIIGRDIKLTAMGDAKSQLNKSYEMLIIEIESLVSKLKDNTYYG